MPEKLSPYKSYGEKLISLFARLMFSGQSHSLAELSKMLKCSKQTILRLVNDIRKSYGVDIVLKVIYPVSGFVDDNFDTVGKVRMRFDPKNLSNESYVSIISCLLIDYAAANIAACRRIRRGLAMQFLLRSGMVSTT